MAVLLVAVLIGGFDGCLLRIAQDQAMTVPGILAWRFVLLGAAIIVNEVRLHDDPWSLLSLVADNKDVTAVGAVTGVSLGFGVLSQLTTLQVDAIALFYTHPFYGTVLTALVLQEPFERRTLMALLLVAPFVMCLVIPAFFGGGGHHEDTQIKSASSHHDSWQGDLFAVVSAIGFATFVTCTRYCSTRRPGAVPCVIVGYGVGEFLTGVGAAIYASSSLLTGLNPISAVAIMADVLAILIWARLTATASEYLTVPEVTLISLIDILNNRI